MTGVEEALVVERKTVAKPRPGEWLITGFMLAFFATAYLLAADFPFRAALFPQMVSALGAVLSALRLIVLFRQARGARREPAPAPTAPSPADRPAADTPAAATPEAPAPPAVPAAPGDTARTATTSTGGATAATTVGASSELEIVDDDVEDDAGMEYVFASAGGRAWLEALSWIVTFFLAFFFLGAFLSVPLFALFYLRFSGKTSWLAAGIYAVVTGLLIYAVFREIVYIPLPTGVLPFMQV